MAIQAITPERAIVEPCVIGKQGRVVTLTTAVKRFLESAPPYFTIYIIGDPGFGKSTALRHLAHELADHAEIEFVDECPFAERKFQARRIVAAADNAAAELRAREENKAHHDYLDEPVFQLAPWTIDHWIEYLLVAHPDACGSVMARIRDNSKMNLLNGNAALCALVLDAFANDNSLTDIPDVLRKKLDEFFVDPKIRTDAMKVALSEFLLGDVELGFDTPRARLSKVAHGPYFRALLSSPMILRNLATIRIFEDLHQRRVPKYLKRTISPELIRTIGETIANDPVPHKRLERILESRFASKYHSNAASILHATNEGWQPKPGCHINLTGAKLSGADWSSLRLQKVKLANADLSCGRFRETDFSSMPLQKANFGKANLQRANFSETLANAIDFSGADLRYCTARHAEWFGANLNCAILEGANLEYINLGASDCRNSNFVRANLTNAELEDSKLDGADFTNACLNFIWLRHSTDFRTVTLKGATLVKTLLHQCNFEGCNARCADFSESKLNHSLFTESDMRGASFENADLRECGLFGVSWSDVDLRGADLRGATFHAGSSRSGLVDSFLASEGTRTGFYTDEYLEQTFRSPEEIRVADLRGADLRGANIFETDFYLVDLRGAKYHDAQAEHLRRCGAILESRV